MHGRLSAANPLRDRHPEIVAALYKNEIRKVNMQLKKLGETLHLPIKLTMYVARHSWATAAHKKKVPISVISQGLGHDSKKTTMWCT